MFLTRFMAGRLGARKCNRKPAERVVIVLQENLSSFFFFFHLEFRSACNYLAHSAYLYKSWLTNMCLGQEQSAGGG